MAQATSRGLLSRRPPARPPFRKNPLAFESLEPRLLLSGVAFAPGVEAAVGDGLNQLANFADSLQQLGEFAQNVPVVGQAAGPVIDLGAKLRDRIVTPAQNYFGIAAGAASSGGLTQALNDAFGDAVNFTDESAGSVVRIRVDGLSDSGTAADLGIDLGQIASQLGLDFGDTRLDLKVAYGFNGGFVFGFDLDPALSPAEGFFVDFNGTSLDFTIDTPFAGDATEQDKTFAIRLGMLEASVNNGQFDLDGSIQVGFAGDKTFTAQELLGTPVTDLVTVSSSLALAAALPVTASVGGTPLGNAELDITVTGDFDNGFDVDVDIDGLGGGDALAQAYKNFANITPGNVIAALQELASGVQDLAEGFNLPNGIPFVEDALADVLAFAEQVEALTDRLTDIGLQGGLQIVQSALAGTAQFNVVVDGVSTAISVSLDALADLQALVTEVNSQLTAASAKAQATLEDGRLVLRATDEAVQAITLGGVNTVASQVLGLADTQGSLPLYNFFSFDQLEDIVDAYLPAGLTLDYDQASSTLGFKLALEGDVDRHLHLGFDESIDLGLATLAVSGSASADADAAVLLSLDAGFSLLPMTLATQLTDLNGGLGLRTTGNANADLNIKLSDGSLAAVDLDGLGAAATVGDLITQLESATGGRLDVAINFSQSGLDFIDLSNGSGSFMVSLAPGSATVVDLGLGVGVADVDGDGTIEGGGIVSRFFLKPYDAGTGTFLAANVALQASDLSLGAALGPLSLELTGDMQLQIGGLGALVDPDASGRIYLNELLQAGTDAVSVDFGSFADPGDLTSAFTELADGTEIASVDLEMHFDDAGAFGIDLGGELAQFSIKLVASTVGGLSFDADIDLDTGALPNFADILQSLEQLTLPQLISLGLDMVGQFRQLDLFDVELPFIDQSLNDLISIVSDAVSGVLGNYADLRDNLESALTAAIDYLQTQAGAVPGLAASLAAIGAEGQDALFHQLDRLVGAVQALPADFDLLLDGASAPMLALVAAFRGFRSTLDDLKDEYGAAADAVVDFFGQTVATVPALAEKSLLRVVTDLLPSGDRVLGVLMEVIGLELIDLADPANAAIVAAVTTARDAVATLADNLPTLPNPDDFAQQPIKDAINAANALLDSARQQLEQVEAALTDSVDELSVFAALRAVPALAGALDDLADAVTELLDGNNGIDDATITAAIAQVRAFLADVAADVQDELFNQVFPSGALGFSMPDQDVFQIDLYVKRAFLDKTVDLSFDAEGVGLPSFLPLDFDATVTGDLDLFAEFRLGFGLDLTGASPQAFFAADSGVSLNAGMDLAVDGSLSLGGLEASIAGGRLALGRGLDLGDDNAIGGAGADADTFEGPARLALGFTDPGNGRVYFSDIASSVDASLDATLLVSLPVELFGNTYPIGAEVTLTDFSDFSYQLQLPPNMVQDILNSVSELSLANLLEGLKILFGTLDSIVKSDVVAQLPAIGDDLSSIDIFGDIEALIAEAQDFVDNTLGGLNDAEDLRDGLKKLIFDTFGPGGAGTGIGFTALDLLDLADTNNDNAITWEDVPVSFTGADITAANALDLFDAGFEFDLVFGFSETWLVPLEFDFAGMGLGLSSTAEMALRLAPRVGVTFGLDKAHGFYVDLDSPATGGAVDVLASLTPDSALELDLWFLTLGAEAAAIEDVNHDGDLDDLFDEAADGIDYNDDGDTTDSGAEADLDNGDGEITGGVGVVGSVALDLGSGLLTFTSLDAFAPTVTFDLAADMDIVFTAELGGQQDLPSISALLDFDFSMSNAAAIQAPTVRFANIEIDLGAFFRDNIAPVIEIFETYLQPLQAIFDVVGAEIPVISDLAELLGQDPVTFLSLIELLGSGFDDLTNFLQTIQAIADIVDTLTDIATNLGDGIISFGDLEMPNIDVRDAANKNVVKAFNDPTKLTELIGGVIEQLTGAKLQQTLGGAADDLNALKDGQTTKNVGIQAGKFYFPIIDDPFGTVAGFLLGQTRDLVVWDLPDFVAEFGFKQLFGPIFPPIPLFVSIFGNFKFQTDFAIGFDTRGIQQGAADFYKGFYLRDWVDADKDGILDPNETTEARELGLDLEFGAGAELNVVVASAGVEGGISAAITADWHDLLQDGKFYVDELGQRLSQGLQCIFELSGQLNAFLRAFVKIGFDTPFGFVTLFEESLNLVNVTLLDFSVSCPPLPIPQPGSQNVDAAHPDDVYLNIGNRAQFRQPGATDVAEVVEIFGERQTDKNAATAIALDAGITDADGDGDIDSDDVSAWTGNGNTLSATIDLNGDNALDTDEARLLEDLNSNGSVTGGAGDASSIMLIGFGQWQIFRDATHIRGDAGLEDDKITLDHSVLVAATIRGGVGNDKLQGGQGGDALYGDAGEDQLIGGFGNDVLEGGDDNDQIWGNAGSDTLRGGAGADALAGDDGNNAQPKVLNAEGKPVAPVQLVPVASLGDLMFGDDGDDNLMGEFGNDTMHGGAGADQLTGGVGDDVLHGDADPDLLEGDAGSDTLFGGTGNDLLFGQADGISTAEDGDDTLDGGADNDTIRDDRGHDTAIGGFGDDFIVTGVGNDRIWGDSDSRGAVTAGYNGRDTIHADRDALPAVDDGLGLGNGNDYVEGGGNADVVHAGAGDDRVIGGSASAAAGVVAYSGSDGADLIHAGDGDDTVAGDNAVIGVRGDVTSARTVTTDAAGGAGADTVYGGAGNDWIFGGGAGDTLAGDDAGGTGADIVVGDQGSASATSVQSIHDATAGAEGADLVYGYGGNDFLLGGGQGDTLYGSLGDDVLLGDHGTITLVGGVVVRVVTTTPTQGGNDLITGDQGNDIAFGGAGGDTISGGANSAGDGADILFGDHGDARFQDGSASENDLVSLDPDQGGVDTISAGFGNDIVVGGSGGADATGPGANDGDLLYGQDGNDIVLGDNAQILRSAGAAPLVESIGSIFTHRGGDDQVFGGKGNDALLGGFGLDLVRGQDGDDVMLGDNGELAFALDADLGTLDRVTSIAFEDGHADVLTGDAGRDIAIGGTAGDAIHGNDADDTAPDQDGGDLLIGDNGQATLAAGGGFFTVNLQGAVSAVSAAVAADAVDTTGGADTIEGNAGADLIIAGVNAGGVDQVWGDRGVVSAASSGRDGADVILGDNGALLFALEAVPDRNSLDRVDAQVSPVLGGRDQVRGQAGGDLVIGGVGGDDVHGDDENATAGAADGNDLLLGDNAIVTLAVAATPGALNFAGGAVSSVVSHDTSTASGGADLVTGNAGGDLIVGGVAGDALYGDAAAKGSADGDDVVLGDNGRLAWLYAGDAAFAALEATLPKDLNGGAPGKFDNSVVTLDLVSTQLAPVALGGRDLIYGDNGSDVLMGGEDSDTVFGDDGNDATTSSGGRDLIFGDHGRLYPQHGLLAAGQVNSRNFFAIDTGAGAFAAGDRLFGEEGDDILLGQQGDDVLYGGAGHDEMVGGHNTAGGVDELAAAVVNASGGFNDVMDGGSGDDAMAGDNATIWRQANDTSPRFGTLVAGATTIYTTDSDSITVNVDGTDRSDPYSSVGWDITLLDHAESTAAAQYGHDMIAGGAQRDTIFGGLGNDLVHGDGVITETVIAAPAPTAFETDVTGGDAPRTYTLVLGAQATDQDDYVEGNGGNDRIYGGLGQDDLIGGSSSFFGLVANTDRPDGSDTIFGGDGSQTARSVDTVTGHVRDADQIVGDNANVSRLVGAGGAALTYAYDNYGGSERLVVRAVDQLDYKLGGAEYHRTTYVNGVAQATASLPKDQGAGDVIRGEDGDDSVYAMVGSDIVYGDAQDDDIVGGYGHDWISGGTGQDGVIGDDGIVRTSRNGTAEGLYGIAATAPSTISTPGKIQLADINPTGALKKSVDLTPISVDPDWQARDDEFPDTEGASPYADDIIYGGLGGDFLHGGSGDDAISGAEALPAFFSAPANAGDVLGFRVDDLDGAQTNNRDRAGEFAAYDEYNPLKKIDGFLLNFDTGEQSPGVTGTASDGNDAIFGDVGNDWLVGGTGRDNLYGGWGNDLLNADDKQETAGGLNTSPDTDPTYEDRAYGGAGRDVLIGNTGGDRLIDWVGEFNSYLVPFAPFGMATVSRTLQPQLAEFLYALSRADGADATVAADRGADASRNGEPDGELGLVLQKDFAWQDQTGAPSDPQAGNIPGGKRDVLRSANFNQNQAMGFTPDSGSWTVSSGRFQVAPAALGADAVSVWNHQAPTPSYFELTATINAVKPLAGYKANAFVVFDYWGPNDFKYAGINVSTNKIEIGQRTAAGWQVVASANAQLKSGTDYNLLLAINGTNATLVVNNTQSLTHTFAARVDALGVRHNLNAGMVGLGADNARAQIDNVNLQVLPPNISFTRTEGFSAAPTLIGPKSGTWVLGSAGRYDMTTATGQPALAAGDLAVGANALLALETVVRTGSGSSVAGLAFDVYSSTDFKWVALDDAANKVLVGHYTARTGWVVDASVARTVVTGQDHTLSVTLRGSTVSVLVDGSAAISHAYNSLVTDGGFGLMGRSGSASFDRFTVQSDDPRLSDAAPQGLALATATATGTGTSASTITHGAPDAQALADVARVALEDFAPAAARSPLVQALLDGLRLRVEDLGGQALALYDDGAIVVDDDAAGQGWFIDGTPRGAAELARLADGRVDLLTVLRHEIGHALGQSHEAEGVMADTLAAGVRLGVDGGQGSHHDATAGSGAALIDWGRTLGQDRAGTAAPAQAARPDWRAAMSIKL